jgi:hypothetical protein
MTQTVTSRQDNITLSSVESDLLYEVVDSHIVEKEPLGAYEILVGSFLNTCLDGFARANNWPGGQCNAVRLRCWAIATTS